MTKLKRYFSLSLSLLLIAGVLSACSALIGPRDIEVRQEKLQQNLDRKFPMHHRVLGIFDVELGHPQLAILAENNRVALTFDLNVTPLLARQSWRGNMAISGRLQVDPVRNTIYIADTHVDQFALDNMDAGKQAQLASVANLLSDTLVKNVAVHTFKPEDLRYAGVQFELTAIDTRPGALLARLRPAEPGRAGR
ncbi:DUF1439 domain-containing protein [Duganella phyllosphaerae]|uniref:DUF1439 domain-containing protein n=1 Tax=Duganella phyllosphaerae TaxID=762836 RepID=A0A1E7WD34_9BURK|nr:DUF1439 domain-containing protein [Duganella phyllosphaerae]OEZ95641.1 hypothetical protein DUPY_42480 [Duganella phyllosphaerae]